MDKENFEQLVKSIKDMKRHIAGKRVRGIRVTRIETTDVLAIRKAANLSQPRFAKLIGVNLRTLQNWEQGRTRPSGPARALLKIVASNPKSAIEALHA
jgi:putative transcriptional regulator